MYCKLPLDRLAKAYNPEEVILVKPVVLKIRTMEMEYLLASSNQWTKLYIKIANVHLPYRFPENVSSEVQK